MYPGQNLKNIFANHINNFIPSKIISLNNETIYLFNIRRLLAKKTIAWRLHFSLGGYDKYRALAAKCTKKFQIIIEKEKMAKF